MPDIKVLSITDTQVQPRAEIYIPLDSNGQFNAEPAFVEGIDRVMQDVAKGLLTVKGSNYLAPNYGTNLSTLTRGVKFSDIETQVTEEVQTVLGYIASFTASEENAAEQLTDLVSLDVNETIGSIDLQITVQTGSNETTTVVFS